eukprot:scaffold26522_cov63-Phaeocystis_antarctica.AAC.4
MRVSRSCSIRMLVSCVLTVVSWSPTLRSRWCRQPGSSGSCDVSAPLYMCLGVLKSGGFGTCDEPCRRKLAQGALAAGLGVQRVAAVAATKPTVSTVSTVSTMATVATVATVVAAAVACVEGPGRQSGAVAVEHAVCGAHTHDSSFTSGGASVDGSGDCGAESEVVWWCGERVTEEREQATRAFVMGC